MSDPKQTLADWRAEIVEELKKAREDLDAAEAQHSIAASAAGVASSTHRELQDALQGITHRPAGLASVALAGPLALRLDEHKRAAAAADSNKARAHGARELVVRRIGELQRAISQIDQLSAPADEQAAS